MKKIVFTGGGSAGHVTPNIAIIPKLQEAGWTVEYIGSESGLEKQIIEDFGIPYHGISSGKLRRYFDLKNLKDPFKVMKGTVQSFLLLKKIKPQMIFSKGGFVSVPVIIGGWLNRIPIIIHESDMTPGLANRISIPFATKVCVTFPETLRHFAADKAVETGPPLRTEVLKGNAEQGRQFCGFSKELPVLLIMGGSLGAKAINQAVRANLPRLTVQFQIVHICGKGQTDRKFDGILGYKQFEYVGAELPDLFAMSDLVVSRAGSNAIFEILALKKPNILIPLTKEASRGDQIINARSFEKMGYSRILYEEDLTEASLWEAINELYRDRQKYISAMKDKQLSNSVDKIVELIEEVASSRK